MFLPIVRRFPALLHGNTLQSFRFASTELVKTQVDDKTGIAVVTLNRPRVNSLNLDLFRAISLTLNDVEKNNSTGMILTSSLDTVFCAGLDLTELIKPDKGRFEEFWTTFQDVWIKLFSFHLPTAAAINGHAPAGGCLLSMSCEYRAMRSNFTIGLNETLPGIVAPLWVMATMENILPRREVELALTLGKLYSTQKAHEIGLVDDVVETKEEAIAKCTKFIEKFTMVPKTARGLTKQAFRKKCLETLDRDADLQTFYNHISNPQVQEGLRLYIEGLKKK